MGKTGKNKLKSLCSFLIAVVLLVGVVPAEASQIAEADNLIVSAEDPTAGVEIVAVAIQDIVTAYTEVNADDIAALETLKNDVFSLIMTYESLASEDQMLLSDSMNYIHMIADEIDNMYNTVLSAVEGGSISLEENGIENSWRFLNGESVSDVREVIDNETRLLFEQVTDADVPYSNQEDYEYSEEDMFADSDIDVFEYTVGSNATYQGIDVSHHQGYIDWQKVKNAGIDFAIIRCGYGKNVTSQDDSRWEYNASSCESLGIPYGVYLYSYAETDEGINGEVQHTLRLLQNHTPSLPVYIDIEENKQFALGGSVLSNFATSFCSQIANAGYKSGLYTSRSHWNTYFGTFAALPSYYHWVAEYNTNCNYSGRYETWQYSSTGSVNGITGNVDLDIWYGEFNESDAEVDTRYSPYLPAKAYALSTGKVTVYDKNYNAYSTSSRWIDGANDLCIIKEVYTNGFCLVQYPTSGEDREAMVRTTDFIPSCTPSQYTANKYYDAFRRPSGSETIGSVSEGDNCLMMSSSGGRTQVIYPTSSVHKIGWIEKEADVATGSEMGSGYDAVLPDGDYQIVSAADASYYLDIVGTAQPATGGTNVAICGPDAGFLPSYEVWTITYSGGFYTIRQKGTDMCLDVTDADRKSGANIQMCQSNGSSAQKWAISWFDNWKGYRLQAKCSGYSLDITGASLTTGTNVQQHVGNNSDAQCWLFIPYEPARTVADGRYVLVSVLDPHLVLDISGDTGNVQDETNVQVWNDSAPSRYNSIDVKYLEHGYYRLTHAASGKSLDVNGSSTANAANIQVYAAGDQNNQKWAIMKQGDGYMVVSRCSGLVMDVKDGGTADGTNVRQHYYNGSKAQTWKFVQAEYKVSYDANGGSGAPSAQTKYYGNALTLSGTKPTMTGRTFKGWATSRTATSANYQPGGSYTDNKDMTLYAVWEDIRVTGVGLNVSSATMRKGETKQLTATVSPSNALDRSVTWTSSDTSVATVSAGGLVTAVGAGSADITVKTKDGGKTAVCRVTVPSAYLDLNGHLDGASSGNIKNYGTADIYVDGKQVTNDCADYYQQLAAGTKYEIKDIKALAGHTYVGVKSGSLTGTIGTEKVTVVLEFSTKRVTGVSLSASTASMKVGETKQLTATVSPSDAFDRSVTWTSSNTTAARVDSAGKVTAVAEGTADITATTTDGGKKAVCRVTVTRNSISGFTVTLSPASYTYDGKAKEPAVTVSNGGMSLTSGTDYTATYANNTNAGTATVTVTGKGKYSGTITKNFTINKASIASATVSGISNKTYNGSAQTQSPTVKVADKTLANGTDYTLSYSNNTNAGTATVTITGKGNYSGSLSKTFTISAASISGATVTGIANKTYTGSAQTQSTTVKVGDRTLTNGTDYALSYSNNTNAGTAIVTITGRGNYSGSISKTFTISAASITGATVTGISNKTYTGSAQTQSPTVKVGDRTLTSGTDYTLSYSNNTNAGTATVTITGKGNYSGSLSKTFTINKAAAKLTFASASISKTTLDGAFTNSLTKTTDGTVTFKSSNTAVAAVNSTSGQVTVKGIGTATITATAAEGTNYKAGSASYTVTVVDGRTDISGCTVTLSPASYTYNGKARKPAVTVTDGTATLTPGTDYTVTYTNNKNAGTATVTVTGTGSYTGAVSKTFKINKAAAKLTFAESGVSKKTTDAAFTNELTKTTDGTVTFSSSDTAVAAVDSSTGLVTIKGAGTATITAAAAAGKNYKAGSAGYTLTVTAPASTGFSDVQDPTHPYYKAIYWAADAGITKGYSDGTFGIDKPCTRSEAVMFLWRLAGKPEPVDALSSPFRDVPKTHAHYKAILWASQKGITKGYPDGTFGINKTCTRGQIMTFIWRFKGQPAPKAVAKSPFSDVPVNHAYYKAILWGSQNGVTNGFSDGTFGINKDCTRGQIVTFLYRIK